MVAVYTTLYLLIPRSLLRKKYVRFGLQYLILLLVCGVLQRVFLHLFYENLLLQEQQALFDPRAIFRAMILINSTVLFVSAIKMVQLWHKEHDEFTRLKESTGSGIVEIKSDKRLFRIHTEDILFIEGLGNYVVYHTKDQKLISYTSLKEAIEGLPSSFVRIHKSYVVNKNQIKSYSPESVEINETFLPVGRSFKADFRI